MDILDWNKLSAAEQTLALTRPVQTVAKQTRQTVAQLIGHVREQGDNALRHITAQLDDVELENFAVTKDEFAAAHQAISTQLYEAMRQAFTHIEMYHRAGQAKSYAVETAPGVLCEKIIRPIQRVGLYVPAGSAPLPSTALMLGIPAKLAGCPNIILCTPPRKDGSADPAVLVAAQLTGIHQVFKIGGAHAIAAMAYGTQTIPACDKLFGPGNSYVTEAKQQIAQAGAAAIDMPAGPSEVLVIADKGANPVFVAADLLSQAEHGPDSQVLLLSDNENILDSVRTELTKQVEQLSRKNITLQALNSSRLIKVDTLEEAFFISNRYAPEHLILALRKPRNWLKHVQTAGSVFLGDYTPEALGDYCSGTNHVLPTAGAARAYSGISIFSFQNQISVQSASAEGLNNIGQCAITLANAESLGAHANAVAVRLKAINANMQG